MGECPYGSERIDDLARLMTASSSAVQARPRPAAPRGAWVPLQHGAWAMLVVPFAFGVVLAVRAGAAGWHLVALFAFWMLGYFAFNAASGWLKASARRRPGYVRPLLTYAAASALCGVTTLALGGWAMAGWAVAYLPLVAPALWLASRRRERATIGGALTVAAACLMVLVVRFPDPRALLAAGPDAVGAGLVALLLFGYFFGTVLYVKTNIRERNSRGYLVASVAWHAAWTLLAFGLGALGAAPWWWAAFFAVTTARAALVPGRGWSPKRLGLVEGGLCVALAMLFLIG